jgi:hypothetical protein
MAHHWDEGDHLGTGTRFHPPADYLQREAEAVAGLEEEEACYPAVKGDQKHA